MRRNRSDGISDIDADILRRIGQGYLRKRNLDLRLREFLNDRTVLIVDSALTIRLDAVSPEEGRIRHDGEDDPQCLCSDICRIVGVGRFQSDIRHVDDMRFRIDHQICRNVCAAVKSAEIVVIDAAFTRRDDKLRLNDIRDRGVFDRISCHV